MFKTAQKAKLQLFTHVIGAGTRFAPRIGDAGGISRELRQALPVPAKGTVLVCTIRVP